MAESQKKCPSCLEFINSEAYKCRYCGTILSSNPFDKRHPNFSGAILGTLLMGIGFIFIFSLRYTEAERNPSFAFDRAAKQIVVQNDKLTKKNPGISIIGEIKNESKINWYSVDVKAKVYDKKGETVDIIERQILSLRPGEIKVFKMCSHCSDSDNPVDFGKYEIFIEDAIVNRWK